jgi:hypothetical protein
LLFAWRVALAELLGLKGLLFFTSFRSFELKVASALLFCGHYKEESRECANTIAPEGTRLV